MTDSSKAMNSKIGTNFLWALKIASYFFITYFTVVFVKLITDIQWTSFQRGFREIAFWIMFPTYPFNDGLLIPFHVDQSHLTPNESIPHVYYIQPTDNAPQVMMDAMRSLDRAVVWKDFIKDSGNVLSKYQEDQYVYNTFNTDDTFDFMANYSNRQHVELTLGEGILRANETNDLYLGFNYKLTQNNPEFKKDIYDAYSFHGEEFAKAPGLESAVHHCFLYYGNRFSTGGHQAPVADWFLQIANTKVWRFVDPSYTPYMRPMLGSNYVGMISGYSYLQNNTRIPYVDVATNPGDLLFFPPHWWHEVHNVHPDAFGLAVGFRPLKTIYPLKWLLFPWTTPKGQIIHKLSMIPAFALKILSSAGDTLFAGKSDTKSGVEHRKQSGRETRKKRMKNLYGDFSWDKYKLEMENIYSKPYTKEDVNLWRKTHAGMMKTEL